MDFLDIILDLGEPRENVSRSLRVDEYDVLKIVDKENYCIIRVQNTVEINLKYGENHSPSGGGDL